MPTIDCFDPFLSSHAYIVHRTKVAQHVDEGLSCYTGISVPISIMYNTDIDMIPTTVGLMAYDYSGLLLEIC